MNDRINGWINTVLKELSKLDKDKGVEILRSGGCECAKSSELLNGAKEIREQFSKETYPKTILDAYKKQYYDTPRLSMNGDEITLIFEECTCPLVKNGIDNGFLCNCTVGYTKKIFETLFGKKVEIDLQKSILRGNEICKQIIKIVQE